MREFLRNNYFKYVFWTIAYLLWVIWVGNYWLLFGLPIIFDLYISKKVNWTFWKKRGVKKHSKVVEWFDALIFAVIAASFIRMFFIEAFTIPTSSMEKSLLVGDYLFVSKLSYGPKLPNTPLSIPFVPHTMPTTKSTPSFLTWLQFPYKRIAGFGEVERNDVVVFNFPEGDTVASNIPEQSYYQLCRTYGRDRVWTDKVNFGEIVVRPVDKREFYIKRCVAISGDTINIKHGQLFINGKKQEEVERMQYNYWIQTDGSRINEKHLENLEVSNDDALNYDPTYSTYDLPLMKKNVEAIKAFSNVRMVVKKEKPDSIWSTYIFPHDEKYQWNEDNFGPLWIPKKGVTIDLNLNNLPCYKRIIGYYEGNDLEVKGDDIFINGEKSTTYTFKMNYFWMMGDNRHNSADSRFWGFVPEDHVVGKAVFVWLSLDKDKGLFDGKIRWNRMFRFIH
ncbi:MAG: S26 family signal peptidase [Marinilabiliales bacterium]|nr:MAG: S26 family signal peptidase [Marinilabiliales bacterium]